MKKYIRNRLCIPIKGFNRSIIYDLTRKNYFFIPNNLFELLDNDSIITINNNDYINFLLDNEIIFEVINENDQLFFPSINLDFHTPYDLSSLIIESNIDLTVLENLNLQIENLTLIINKIEPNIFEIIIKILNLIEIESINIVYSKCKYFKINHLEVFEKIPEILSIMVFEYNLDFNSNNHNFDFLVFENSFEIYTKNVFPSKFSVNYESFFESQNFNNYFNRKLYINDKGEIRNGLTSKKIKTSKNIKEIIDSVEFKYLSTSKKDNTLVCSDCEFRRMCLDSRVPIYNKELNLWFHKNECRYNPYISKWEDEVGYKDLKSCGIKIDSKGNFKIDNIKKLKEYNVYLWGS